MEPTMNLVVLTELLSSRPGGVELSLLRNGTEVAGVQHVAGATVTTSGPLALALLMSGGADLETAYRAALVTAHPELTNGDSR
jgi:hypothetical protein